MDRAAAKRALECPPPAAEERDAKKPCCHRDPPPPPATGGLPEISSLLSSLSVAKRHCPPTPPAAPPLKRPRRHYHDDALHARMRGLAIRCRGTAGMGEGKERRERDWAGFLPELLGLVCDRLPLADVPRFGAVCRHWRSCAFPVYPADAAPVLLSSNLAAAGAVRCYSPHLHKMFVLAAPPLPEGSRVVSAAAGGWVMLKTPSKTVLLANLLDGTVHETPERDGDDQGFLFCAPRRRRHHGDNAHNGNDDCRFDVFAVHAGFDTIKFQSWGGGSSGGWESAEQPNSSGRPLCCSPVMHKGRLYCLGPKGALAAYDPGAAMWCVLLADASFGPELAYKHCYLVDSPSELLAVLTGINGAPPIHVLRFDKMEMEWKKVKSLDGRSLFTGTTTSVAMAKPVVESMADKVYLPRFYGRPQVIQAKLAESDGRIFFVAKPFEPEQQGLVAAAAGGGDGGAWCYDMESDSGGQLAGSKTLLQYVWAHFGRDASPSSDEYDVDDDDIDIDDDDDDDIDMDDDDGMAMVTDQDHDPAS